jgi:outer membrane protein TolC
MRRLFNHSRPLIISLILGILPVLRTEAGEVMTWEDCVRIAAENNPALTAARAQIDAADAGTHAARSAMLPQLSAGASATRGERDNSPDTDRTAYGTSLNIEQSLYSGGRNYATVRAADATRERAGASAAAVMARTTYDLRTAFVDLLYAQTQLQLLREIEKRRQDNMELVDLRYEGGREHKGSLALSQASLFDAQVQTRQAQRLMEVNRQMLWRTIGLTTQPGTLEVAGAMEPSTSAEISDWDELARNTPDYAVGSASKAVSAAQVEVARSGHWPKLSLAGATGRQGDDETFEEDSWSAGLKLSFPFWSGGQTTHEIHKAEASLREAEATLADTLNSLVRNLADANQALANTLESIDVQRRYVAAADIRAEISRQQYGDGLLSFENWDLIENDLISKRKRLLDSQRASLLAEATWWRTTGYEAFMSSRPK